MKNLFLFSKKFENQLVRPSSSEKTEIIFIEFWTIYDFEL